MNASRYYNILSLKEGSDIVFAPGRIEVDLSSRDHIVNIQNDVDFLAARDPKTFFFVSGGGTYLVNKRYIATVKRHSGARINPNKWSLFTGRADSERELSHPHLIVRELFEELILCQGDTLLVPKNAALQEIIDEAYAQKSNWHAQAEIAGDILPLSNTVLQVRSDNAIWEQQVFHHVNAVNDINLLWVMAIKLDLEALSMIDGERQGEGGGREVALIDLMTGDLRLFTGRQKEEMIFTCSPEFCTPHLLSLVGQLQRELGFKGTN